MSAQETFLSIMFSLVRLSVVRTHTYRRIEVFSGETRNDAPHYVLLVIINAAVSGAGDTKQYSHENNDLSYGIDLLFVLFHPLQYGG